MNATDTDTATDTALAALAAAYGILPGWWALDGTWVDTGPDTMLACLRAMGAIDTAADAKERLAADRAAKAKRLLPRRLIVEAGVPSRHPVRGVVPWRIEQADGQATDGQLDVGLDLPPLPLGLHRLTMDEEVCLVIAAPPRAPSLADLTGRGRAWGITGAVHALWQQGAANRRGRAADLGAAMAALAPGGAAFFGINPVHALGAAFDGASPYSPSHRGFYDTALVGSGQGAAPGAETGLIDHNADRRALLAEQQKRFDAAMLGEREAPTGRAAFEAFRAAGGAALEAFALFEALSLVHGPDWRSWPAGLENPDTEAARAFATTHPAEVAFHAWLQMEADRALASAQASARQAGMPLGLYADLAVGVRPGGAETWARQGGDAGAIFARGVSLGAPPDMFSSEGQSWGLAPFSPPGLAADGFAAFAETLRATMRHAGMIRVDHILGLERTFWVPEDGTPGGYVASDTDALFAILRLEAAQNGCLVVGEDLGVVPDGLRPRMADNGIYGSAIAMFEHWEGQLRAPWHYGSETLASFGTHDTATLAGWWCGHDIDLRLDLGLTEAEDAATLHRARAADRLTLMALLAEAWILPEGIDRDAPPTEITEELISAIHRLLARAPSALVAAQLDDVLGTLEQPNLPGTIDGHPNWCRRHAAAVEDLAANPAVHGISSIMRQEGRG